MRVILIRHGETASNRDGRTQGQSDSELDSEGLAQAMALATSLRSEKIDAVYSSPLKRALTTAQSIAEPHGLTPRLDNDLRELDEGDLDGLTFEELQANHADFLQQWQRDPGPLKMPNGESLLDLQERACASLERIVKNHPGDSTVVIVSHNFTILTILCRVIGLDLAKFRNLELSVAGKNIITFSENGPVLSLLNDTHHLTTLPRTTPVPSSKVNC